MEPGSLEDLRRTQGAGSVGAAARFDGGRRTGRQRRRLALEGSVHPAGADGARAAGSESHVHRRRCCSRRRRSCRSPTTRMDRVQITHDGSVGDRPGRQGATWTTGSRSSPTSIASTRRPASARRCSRGRSARSACRPTGSTSSIGRTSRSGRTTSRRTSTSNITQSAPVSFVNAEEDHVGEKPSYGVSGFTKDGKSVMLDHQYDLWVVSLDGSGPPRNLTNGVGTKSETAIPLRAPRARRQRAGVRWIRRRRRRRWSRRRQRRDDRSVEAGAALGVHRTGQEGRLLPARRRPAHEARLRGPQLRPSDQGEERRPRARSRARRSSSSPTTG